MPRLSALAFLKTRALGNSNVPQFTASPLHSAAAECDIEGSAEDNGEPVRSFAPQATGDQLIRRLGDPVAETLLRVLTSVRTSQMRAATGPPRERRITKMRT